MGGASDGTTWSDWKLMHLAAPNHAPVIATGDLAVSKGANVAAANLFSAADPDADSVVAVRLHPPDAASGHFEVNGVAKGAQQVIEVSPAQLAQTTFQSGSGSDALYLRPFDGTVWTAWTLFNVNAPINHAPLVTTSDQVVGQRCQACGIPSPSQIWTGTASSRYNSLIVHRVPAADTSTSRAMDTAPNKSSKSLPISRRKCHSDGANGVG